MNTQSRLDRPLGSDWREEGQGSDLSRVRVVLSSLTHVTMTANFCFSLSDKTHRIFWIVIECQYISWYVKTIDALETFDVEICKSVVHMSRSVVLIGLEPIEVISDFKFQVFWPINWIYLHLTENEFEFDQWLNEMSIN